MKAFILNEEYAQIGTADFTAEELNHFTSTGSVPAKLALDSNDISRLGIDEDDFIFIRSNH